MRRTLTFCLTLLFAIPLAACDEGPTQVDRETMVDGQAASASQGATNAAEGTPPNSRGTPPVINNETWGNEHLWEFSAPPNDVLDTGEASHAPFYVIGAVDPNDAHQPGPVFFGAHDHTIPVPPQNRGTYSAMWHIHLVEPADGAVAAGDVLVRDPGACSILCVANPPSQLVYAADLNDNGQIDLPGEYLDSDAEVEQAADMGLVDLRDTGIVFKCPVRDIEG